MKNLCNKYIDRVLNDPSALWEAIGPDAIPQDKLEEAEAVIRECFSSDNFDELCRYMKTHAYRYVFICAVHFEFRERGWGFLTADEFLESGESEVGELMKKVDRDTMASRITRSSDF